MESFVEFKYPVLVKGVEWYIEYHAKHPISKILIRKKIKVNHLRKRPHSTKAINQLITTLEKRLESGWNPFIDELTGNTFTTFEDGLKNYFDTLNDRLRHDDIRKRTIDTYHEKYDLLLSWIKKRGTITYIFQFTDLDAINFFEYLIKTKRSFSRGSQNQWAMQLRSLFKWFIKKRYAVTNPFLAIEIKAEGKKKKTVISTDYMHLIRNYLMQHDIHFWIICGWCFYCGIRRTELTRLQIKNINWREQTITVHHTQSKNHTEEDVIIPDEFFQLLIDNKFNEYPENYYLVSFSHRYSNDKVKKPGPLPMHPNNINRWWNNVRSALDLPLKYKWYNFKHTMLTTIAGRDQVAAQKHGRFVDIVDINPYLGMNEKQIDIVKKFKV